MAKLPDYTALGQAPSARSGAGIHRVDLSAPAQAIVGAGQVLGGAADMLQARADKEREFDTQRRFLEFASAQEEALAQQSQIANPGAFGFREAYTKSYADAAREFFRTVPDELKREYDQKLFVVEDRLSGKALGFEREARSTYYSQAVSDGLTIIENNLYAAPDRFDENLAEGNRFIDNLPDADVSPIVKEQLRREWKEKAQLAALSGMMPEARKAALGRGSDVDLRAIGSGIDGAKAILRAKEGFRDGAYWDVNAHRTGYGSDTVTRDDGTVERVTKDTRVSREDAERDLDRRVREFERAAIEQVGRREWGVLPPHAQAALLSVAYNYGRLPGNVVSAIQSGDISEISQAVAARAGDNDGINAKRRREESAMILGHGSMPATTEGKIDPRFSDMSYVAREKVLAGADDDLRKERAAADAEARAAYTLHKDAMTLGIETGSVLTEQEVLGDTVLDDGDKAALLRALRSRQGDMLATQEAIRQFSQGGLTVDPYSTDGKKIVDNVWSEVSQIVGPEAAQPTLEELVRQSGSVPQSVVNDLRRGFSSSNLAEVAAAGQMAQRLSTIDAAALARRDGGSEVQRMADDFSFYVNKLNMGPEDAARRVMEAQQPEAQRDRKALEPAAKEFRKELEGADLGSVFDESILPFNTPNVGFTPALQAGIMLDYLDIAENEFYRANGDADLAKNRAQEQIKTLYGVTNLSGTATVMKHPPERYWPAMPGSDPYGYVRDQIADELMQFVDDDALGSWFPHEEARQSALPGMRKDAILDNLIIMSTPETDAMVKAGQLPAYFVAYKDPNGNLQTIPGKLFVPDIALVAAEKRRRLDQEIEWAREDDEEIRLRQDDPEGMRDRGLDAFIDGPVLP